MNFSILVSAYRASLGFYPADFRQKFAIEMAQVFEDQLHEEWEHRRFAGIGLVTATAIWEIVSVALPLQSSEHLKPLVDFRNSFTRESSEVRPILSSLGR